MATLGALPTVGGDSGIWSQKLNDALTAFAAQLSAVDNTSDASKPVSTATNTALGLKAALASPAFSGTPTAPTPSAGDNSTKLATTAFVLGQGFAPLSSPVLTGTPTAPTPATSDNTTKIATTAWVNAQGYGTGGTGGTSISDNGNGTLQGGALTWYSKAGADSAFIPDAVSVGKYSPTADGLWGLTGSVTSGSTALTFTTGGLTSAHTGASVWIAGAGAAGALLKTTLTYVSATSATLAVAASTTVTNKMTLIGHDNVTAISNAVTAGTGKRVTFPKGVYFMSGGVTIPNGTNVDATGATFLGGGFVMTTGTELANGTFIGDASGTFGGTIIVPGFATKDFSIIGNSFNYCNWAIIKIASSTNGYTQNIAIRDNRFENGVLGNTYIGQLLDSVFDHNISTTITAGANCYNFPSTQQRNTVSNNTVPAGTRAGIIFLWAAGAQPAPTATQGTDVVGNRIFGNRILGQTEEGISFDGASNASNTFDNSTITSVNTTSKTITLTGSPWASAGTKWQYYYIYIASGSGIGQLHRITAMSNAVITVGDADTTDLAKLTAGDTIVIGNPFHHNSISGNYVDGRSSSTFSIWLYSFCHLNTVQGNTTEGAPIGVAGTNSMAAITGSVTGTTTWCPSSNNVFTGNVVSNATSVTNYYGQVPGIHFLYYNYGAMADFNMVGNCAVGNIIRGGQITLQRNERLLMANVMDRAVVATNTPTNVSATTFGTSQ